MVIETNSNNKDNILRYSVHIEFKLIRSCFTYTEKVAINVNLADGKIFK